MAHTCSSAVLHCIDFRLGPAIKNWLEEQNLLGDCDIISIAGATKEMEFPMGQLVMSHELHETKTIILMNHTDCGAYGGRSAFDSDEAETETHFSAMNDAKSALETKLEGVAIRTVLARIGEDGTVTFDERS